MPEKVKAVCSRCNVNKWAVDFKEGCYADISHNSVCLFCEMKEEYRKEVNALKEENKKLKEEINDLKKTINTPKTKTNTNMTTPNTVPWDTFTSLERKVSSLQEFVERNIAVEEKNSKPNKSGKSTTSTPGKAANKSKTKTNNPSVSFQVSKNSKTKTTNPSVSFQVVKNGVKPKQKTFLPIKVQNRFQLLGQEDEVEGEAVIVGDSIVRGQLDSFCSINPKKRKRFCLPGATVQDITNSVNSVFQEASADSTVIIHVGTNNVLSTRSEELLDKYRKMIKSFKVKTNKLIISGILPRTKGRDRFFSGAHYTNNCLETICKQEGVGFVNLWNDFYNKKNYFLPDGLHLSQEGSAKMGQLFNDAIVNFQMRARLRHLRE
ncbi:MAG: hypothetical protein F6K21_30930 [Symploca sp. SIO2D2]|nr:hypothetical protein [Symploca sp. SIO2D2]